MTSAEVGRLLSAYRAQGQTFTAGGISSFLLDHGARDAPAVVGVHGFPTSAQVYRKVVTAPTDKGLRADYTWARLCRWLFAATDALELDRFHLVVHDIGGPIGFELADAASERVLSMTPLNTIIAMDAFRRPWPMEPFAHRGLGEAWLQSLRAPGAFAAIMRLVG